MLFQAEQVDGLFPPFRLWQFGAWSDGRPERTDSQNLGAASSTVCRAWLVARYARISTDG